MSLPFNITNPGINLVSLLTSQEAEFVTALYAAGAGASEGEVLTWISGVPSWEAPLGGGASVSDTAYNSTTWDGVTTIAPSKNTVRDVIEGLSSVYSAIGHNHTGVYAPELGADDNYVTDAEKIVIGNTSGTNTGDNAVNSLYSGLVTNATHTGEVTGSGALTLDNTAITNKTAVTAVGTDYVLISDTSDSGNLKKALVSDFGGGSGNVTKVGTPVDNQVGVWTGDGTLEGTSALTFDGGIYVTVPDAANKVGLTITQNDNTNDKEGIQINNAGSGDSIYTLNANFGSILGARNTGIGIPYMWTWYDKAVPANGDRLFEIDFYGNNDETTGDEMGAMRVHMRDKASGAQDSSIILRSYYDGTYDDMLQIGENNTIPMNGITVGNPFNAGIVSSNDTNDLILKTGNATTGNITIVDGASGDIQLNPNATGAVRIGSTDSGVIGPNLYFTHYTASPAIGDYVGYINFQSKDSGGNFNVYGGLRCEIVDPTNNAEYGKLVFGVINNQYNEDKIDIDATAIYPHTNNGLTLGSSTKQFSDLFLAEGGVIDWDNGDATLTQSGNDVTLAGASLTARVKPRTGTTTSSATPTINTDNVDFYSITAQTVDITSFTTNLSGTPTEGQKLWIAITGTAARAITWGTSFEASTVALPTTTVTTNRLDVGFIWNAVTSKWRCVASC